MHLYHYWMGSASMTWTRGFDEKPSMQTGLYPRYPKQGIFSWTLADLVFISLNLLNPLIPCRVLHSITLVGIRQSFQSSRARDNTKFLYWWLVILVFCCVPILIRQEGRAAMLSIVTCMEIPFFFVIVKVNIVNVAAFSFSKFMWDILLRDHVGWCIWSNYLLRWGRNQGLPIVETEILYSPW